jgi:nucleoside-diphosphate-sugar epimerase
MPSTIVIFGGSGYIGTATARRWLERGLADEVVIADIRPSELAGQPGIRAVHCDVRQPISADLCPHGAPAWVFNFAAVHREPGHQPQEYFDTNLAGAEHVTAWARAVGCPHIVFTSSISVYGPTTGPTTEDAPKRPISPYGGSKYPAELIHQRWLAEDPMRRLMVVRPGVVYGPHDPGNIGRMVRAIQKGYFAFPGSTRLRKSYAYIEGLLDSVEFVIASGRRSVTYNYVETPTQTLGEIVEVAKRFTGSRAPILSLPTALLLPAAHVVQWLAGDRNPVHPVRVQKAGLPTHIVPQVLLDMGFPFRFSFASSLEHWRGVAPGDFGDATPGAAATRLARAAK